MIGVYKITSPSGRIYIGSSTNIKRREREYRTNNKSCQPKLRNSFKKYGYFAHKFEIICECDISELFRLEYHYGVMFNVLGKNGLNCRLPKIDDLSVCMSDETKAKIGSANKGNKRPDLALMNKSRTGVKISDKAKNNMRAAQLGRKHPEWVKDKIRLAHTGKTKSVEHRRKLSDQKKMSGKKVIHVETGQIFVNLKSASNSLGKHNSFLSHQFKRNVTWGFMLLDNYVS